MRQMLANIQDHPMIPIVVLVLFVALFISLLFMVFRKDSKKLYEEASQMPLTDNGASNE
jgi:cbb3-type cytochrome oxidase subunit 3